MYDYVFVTHLPSFYKVNLYNELAKHLRIHVVFIGQGSTIRTKDFVPSAYLFDYTFLTNGEFETRSRFRSILRFACFILKTKYKKMVVGGWDLPEFWLAFFLNPAGKFSMALESTSEESTIHGLKGRIKKVFLSKVDLVFATGKAHVKLLSQLGYQGAVRITHGVGLINRTKNSIISKTYEKKFLYLGRLSPEKNLDFLIAVFKSLPNCRLTMVGSGPMKECLINNATSNIVFIDHVPNNSLFDVFQANDFLILASLSEPWGLVVEEALHFGRPVLISERCGAAELIHERNGFKFNPESPDQLEKIIRSIDDGIFQELQKNIQCEDDEERGRLQVQCYI